jgi:hypothetical protein
LINDGRILFDGPVRVREGGTLEQTFYRLTGADGRGGRMGARS